MRKVNRLPSFLYALKHGQQVHRVGVVRGSLLKREGVAIPRGGVGVTI